MFEEKSRYYKVEQYKVIDLRGRTVAVTAIPPQPVQSVRGVHLLKQGQRVDHLAAKYIDDPAGFWRICEINDAMLPEALSERQEITIPNKF